jgi:hypothetical protein
VVLQSIVVAHLNGDKNRGGREEARQSSQSQNQSQNYSHSRDREKAVKHTTFQFNDAVKRIRFDDDAVGRGSSSAGSSSSGAGTGASLAGHRKDCSFIVGTASGHLIHHRANQSWSTAFSQKGKVDKVLFAGSATRTSAVAAVAWRGCLVAWADAHAVRLMDISTQSCSLAGPTVSDRLRSQSLTG